MQKQSKNNRSLLALAGEASIQANSKKRCPAIIQKRGKVSQFSLSLPLAQKSQLFQQKQFDVKETIKKLGLYRLRKMQALVRGFLVRRKIYPKQLKDYLIAQSALDLIISNIVYKQASALIVQSVTLGKYDQESLGQQRYLQEYLYNLVIRRVIEKQFEPIAKQAVYETAIFASRPQITYGLNLRDPMELTLYMKIQQIISQESRLIADQCLREQALQRRDLQVVESLIGNMRVLSDLYNEIVGECLLQSVQDYVVENMMEKMLKQVAFVVAEVEYSEALGIQQDKYINSLAIQAQQWLLQQSITQLMLEYCIQGKKVEP